MPTGIYPRRSWQDRFWSYVDVYGPDDCHEWTGTRNKYGYGELYVDGRTRRATHCLFKIITGGWVPKGRIITHKVCHNPPCCNVKHLRLGTCQSNVNDRERDGHGYSPKGERHGLAKLTNDKVLGIVRLLEEGKTGKAIAKLYGVSREAISGIKCGRRWMHITGIEAALENERR